MANKMQNVNFKSVDAFLDYLPEDELAITIALREIILEAMPECEEKLSYNVPFYGMNRKICFIWPASILWGKKKTYEGVRMGFTYGNLLSNEANFLDLRNKKQVGYHDFKSVTEIDREFIEQFLYEAIELDRNWK